MTVKRGRKTVTVSQWGIKVPKSKGESFRRYLLANGDWCPNLKPIPDGDYLVFPTVSESITLPDELADCDCDIKKYEFESRAAVREPARHELIGGIAIMQDDDVSEAEYLLKSRPSIHTVLHCESPVFGEYRIKKFRVLAGKETTRTSYIEYNNRFTIDLAVAYFSARLANERQRVLRLMKDGERVLDMFTGVGPFPIALSKKASVIYAGDINPGAVELLCENLRINRTENVIPMLADALDLSGVLPPHSFDRIIMNLPMTSTAFLETAFSLAKKGGIIHYYTLQSEKGEMLPLLRGFTAGKIDERVVRSYSPTQHHAVYDIVCE